MNLKQIAGWVLVLVICICVATSAYGKIRKFEESCYSGTPGLECKKIVTDTDYRKDGKGDWLKPNHTYHFRTTNGKGCQIRLDENTSTFRNCKASYKSCYAKSSGEWSTSGIVVEASGEGSWSYDLNYTLNWR